MNLILQSTWIATSLQTNYNADYESIYNNGREDFWVSMAELMNNDRRAKALFRSASFLLLLFSLLQPTVFKLEN